MIALFPKNADMPLLFLLKSRSSVDTHSHTHAPTHCHYQTPTQRHTMLLRVVSRFDFGRGSSVRSANTDGYIDVGSDGQTFHIPLDTAKTVVVGADGNMYVLTTLAKLIAVRM